MFAGILSPAVSSTMAELTSIVNNATQFRGTLEHRSACARCGASSVSAEQFRTLSVALPQLSAAAGATIDLRNCIQQLGTCTRGCSCCADPECVLVKSRITRYPRFVPDFIRSGGCTNFDYCDNGLCEKVWRCRKRDVSPTGRSRWSDSRATAPVL